MKKNKVDTEGFTKYVLDLLTEKLDRNNPKKVPVVRIAEALGCHVNTVSNYRDKLRGQKRPPFGQVFALAEALGMTREEILRKLYPDDLEDVTWLLENAQEVIRPLRAALQDGDEKDKAKVLQDLEYVAERRKA